MYRPFRWLVLILVILIILYAVLPTMMIINPEFLRGEIIHSQPELSNNAVEFAIVAVSIFAAGIHAIFIGLYIWLFIMMWKRRNWARITLTILVILAAAGSLASWTAGPAFYSIIIITNVVHAILIGFLWIPRIVNNYFWQN
ncbi:hypothetical protein [Virgibacillus oceani]|uniref:Uncharacterized protein n=1 Tax=Virgibacillus oceani TaxID=1479511 RepID=A0A917M6Z8_9BACI|nr:hypothetical protein [Virgibacillus oceani]GGG79033.1 hypothetical protein GCM10011398_25400 [Virgibacillus oceani]